MTSPAFTSELQRAPVAEAILPDAVMPDLHALCVRFHVSTLDLFGSANSDKFEPRRSDIDFLVEFIPETQLELADNYFGLHGALQQLFGRTVDLVSLKSIQNPFLRRSIERNHRRLYPTP